MNPDENSPAPFESPQPAEDYSLHSEPELVPEPGPVPPHIGEPSATPEFLVPAGPVIPEDLRAPWGWSDLLVLAIISVGGAFLVGTVVVMAFALTGVHLSQLQSSAREQGLFAVISQAVLFLVILGYLAMQMRLRFDAPFWRTIGWRALPGAKLPRPFVYLGFIGAGFLLGLLVQIGSVLFGTKATLPMESLFEDRLTALLLLSMAVLLAPVVEETIFRGYIYPVVARSFGVRASIVATGTLFGLLHSAQLWGGWVQIGLLVVVGIIFTYARAVTRTVFASYLLHVSYNFYVSFGFLIGSHWLRNLQPGP